VRLEFCGQALELDPAGLLHWPERGLVVVADLHLEKGSAFARRGLMLPPYDTHATLLRLEAVLERLRPRTVVSLGDSFHDRRGAELLEPELARQVRRLTGSVEWVWVRGNHDPDPPAGLGGRAVAELSMAGLLFRHAPCGEAGEVAGHLHPKARLVGTRLRL
jgi:DNA ligase-associated metallophosphoesterase